MSHPISLNKIAILISSYYPDYCQGLLDGAIKCLKEKGMNESHYEVVQVPGSFEISYTVHYLAKKNSYDAIICLGVLVKGKTYHFEHIADQVATGIYEAAKEFDIPITYGVLSLENIEDAKERCDPNSDKNRGYESMETAIKMVSLYKKHSHE